MFLDSEDDSDSAPAKLLKSIHSAGLFRRFENNNMGDCLQNFAISLISKLQELPYNFTIDSPPSLSHGSTERLSREPSERLMSSLSRQRKEIAAHFAKVSVPASPPI